VNPTNYNRITDAIAADQMGKTSYTYTDLNSGDQWYVWVATKGNLGHSAWLEYGSIVTIA
jgi:hypothetical protein